MRIPFAVFPEVGVTSLLAMDDAAVGVEVVSIGSEGMVGVALAHEVDHSPHRCIMQVAGRGKRIGAATRTRCSTRRRSPSSARAAIPSTSAAPAGCC